MRLLVLGAGAMGTGIARVSALAGMKVVISDASVKAAQSAHAKLTQVLEKHNAGHLVTFSEDASEVAGECDMVIEAVTEDLGVKQGLFSMLDKKCPPSTIFASNTSSLRIGKIAEATNRKDRFGGLHFFNPVQVMKLVEVVTTEDTSEETRERMAEYVRRIGKTAVHCKDTPGFVVNRLLVPYLVEAVRMVERGEASVEDIDTAMKLGAGYPMGPFELMDHVGVDVIGKVVGGWSREGIVQESGLIRDMVKQGRIGRKGGRGFYEYS